MLYNNISPRMLVQKNKNVPERTNFTLSNFVCVFTLPCLIILALFPGCSGNKQTFPVPPKKISDTFFRMSTVTSTILYTHEEPSEIFSDSSVSSLWSSIDSLLLSWENRFSSEIEGSEIVTLNNRTSKTQPISKELSEMLKYVQKTDEIISGLFDPTLLSIKQFWNPQCDSCRTPILQSSESKVKIDSLLQYTGLNSFTITDSTITFHKRDTKIDIGGVAKGAALMEVEKILSKRGYKNYVLSSGGDITVRGTKLGGQQFVMGVQAPRSPGELVAKLPMSDGTIVTSGDYERFRLDSNGVRIHHLFNAKTGFPADYNMSLTVVAKNPLTADILSTALFALPPKEAIAIAEEIDGVEIFVIDKDEKNYYSSGFPLLYN